MSPEFPLVVRFLETGEEWVLESVKEAAQNLEWFDSEDPEENATVVDARGRAVRLKIVAHEIIRCSIDNA